MTTKKNETEKTLNEHIAETKEKAKQLLTLLDEPHPGLVTWVEAVGRTCRAIGALAEPEKPEGGPGDRALARAYVSAVMEGKPGRPDLEPDWEDVRAQARCMLADSELRGQALLDKLDALDALLRRRGHYERADDDDE